MTAGIIAYVAVSLDGFIAGDEGSVAFLEPFGSDEYGYDAFVRSVGAVAMGSTTYEQILGWGWPYGDTPGLVLTSRDPDPPPHTRIMFSNEATGEALRRYARTVDGRLWIVGGGKVITEGLRQGAIDTLEMFVMPVVLGSGVPLFTGPVEGPLVLTMSEAFTNGVVRLVYAATP